MALVRTRPAASSAAGCTQVAADHAAAFGWAEPAALATPRDAELTSRAAFHLTHLELAFERIYTVTGGVVCSLARQP